MSWEVVLFSFWFNLRFSDQFTKTSSVAFWAASVVGAVGNASAYKPSLCFNLLLDKNQIMLISVTQWVEWWFPQNVAPHPNPWNLLPYLEKRDLHM